MIKRLFSIILISFICFFGINKVYADDTAVSYTSAGQNMYIGIVESDGSYSYEGVNSGTYQPISSYAGYFSIPGANYGVSSGYKEGPRQINIDFTGSNIQADVWYRLDVIVETGNQFSFYSTGINNGGKCAVNISGSWNYSACSSFSSSVSVYSTGSTNKYKISTYVKPKYNGNGIAIEYGNAWPSSWSGVFRVWVNGIESSQGIRITSLNVYLTNDVSGQLGNIGNELNNLNDTQKETNNKLDESINQQKEINNKLNDDDTSESTSEATEFFEGFDTDTHGLTSIITAPLELIGNIAGSTCSPLPLQVPFVNKTMSLPCMSTIYKKHFGGFLTIYQTITFGIIAYWVCVRIFALVKDFKNPEHDEIEVMDL